MKLKKTKKASKMRGKKMGSHGWGARKKHKKSGHRGGKGMSGSGKRADHKKTLITKLYGNKYFGKKGITSKKTARDTRQRINIGQIQLNLMSYLQKGIAKKIGSNYEINLPKHKILGNGNIKDKMNITCLEISTSARKKIEALGGTIVIHKSKKINTPRVVNHKQEKKKSSNFKKE